MIRQRNRTCIRAACGSDKTMYDINNYVAGSETEENFPQAQEEVRKEERKQTIELYDRS